ncbi:unnamed protein product [Bursaphelenchus xylophilus]|uniref:(pine wood nematode) hypothetical protein n=1 Tax=Bursaphelenchus xylophilus TaxID=6326 RepID=A0A1I7SL76_BURXY|nr:unnamed protein product [Bursaphelenchus xylophilus]CAG9129394.1 unnamed protein product [Bursaphelenchus xylophilus]
MAEDKKVAKLRQKVQRYITLIETNDPLHVEHAIDRLESVDMTVDCLQTTGVGRVLNQLRDHEKFGARAAALVDRWRAMASEAARLLRQLSPSVLQEEDERKKKEKKAKKRAVDPFEAQLMAADLDFEPKKKAKTSEKRSGIAAPDAEDIVSAVVHTTGPMEYCAAPSLAVRPAPSKSTAQVEMISDSMFDPTVFKRKERTKVYAGRRKNNFESNEVPSLLLVCQRYLMNNLDSIEELGDVPYRLLKPVLDRCTTDQLDRISARNPQLWSDLDEQWENIVQKTFRNEAQRKKKETWYQCFTRLNKEREARLHRISEGIKQKSTQIMKSEKRTAMVDVINPSFARKRQIRSGIAPSNAVGIPDALEVSKARRQVFTGNKSAINALPSALKGGKATTSYQSRTQKVQPRGALMQKTLKMLKGRR